MTNEAANTVAVSVVIPVRNRKLLLIDLVESLWKQTLDPSRFEIIVSDNCSTDGTPEVVKELQAKSPCRMVFNAMRENRGPAASRNAGARLATGEFIAFVDSDCRVAPRWLESALAAFTDCSIGFVTGSIRHKPEQPVSYFTRSHDPVTVETACYPTMNIVYRRSVFLEADGFDESLCFKDIRGRVVECSDCDLAWRVKETGYRNVFVPEMLVYHERELMKKLHWLLIPMEQYVVPLLVKRHPNARPYLLYRGYFFNFLNIPFYVLVAGLLLAALLQNPWFLLLALPYPLIVARACWRRFKPRPHEMIAWVVLLGVRQAVLCGTLIRASIRYRSLVL